MRNISPVNQAVQQMYKQETFPDSFKIAHVIPIQSVQPKIFDDLRRFLFFQLLRKYFEEILETKMTKF